MKVSCFKFHVSSFMFLIVGLGNPGEEYENTKHNAGRMAVTRLAKKHDLLPFTFDKKSNALVAAGKIGPPAGGEKVTLALPETFMNKSGLAVQELTKSYKLKPKSLFIVHDDIDLTVGRMKISFAKSSAGHKGVEHIMKNLKTNEFYRLRIGIGSARKTKQAMDIVLKNFTPKETLELKKVLKKAVEALTCAITESPEKAMTLYNKN